MTEIGKKLTGYNHDEYIKTLAADVFNARLTQENVVTKTDQVLIIKLQQIKQKTSLLKMNLKS